MTPAGNAPAGNAPAGPAGIAGTLAELRAGVTRLADLLLDLEASPELALLRDAAALRGRSAELAAEAVAAADTLWPRYPLLTTAVDAVAAAVDEDDDQQAEALLGPTAVTLAGGSTTSPVGLLASLERDAAAAAAAVQEVADAWRDVLPRLDLARSEIARLTAAAEAAEAGDDADLAAAARMVEHLAATVAVDPLAVDPAPAEAAIARAAERIHALERRRHAIPDRLVEATRQLAAIREAITAGNLALRRARDRIADPDGLLDPPDPAVVDGDDRSLQPWLRRLEALADGGDWKAAGAGLDQWERVADGWLANAEAAAAANQAPVRRRDDLRGLLEAYRAKAAAIGRAEDLALTDPHRAAREALHRQPCDLEEATALLHAYRDAVNAVLPPPGDAP